MELKNVSANFLGDSITEGVGTTGPDKCFHQIIARKYGMKIARNYGIGGTRFAKQTVSNAGNDLDFGGRMWDMADDAQLVVLFGGTNDFGHGDAPIGTFSDRENNTFYGACHYIMEGLIKKYPDARIVVMTPLHRCNEDQLKGDGYKTYNYGALKVYVDIIKEVAEYYSLPIIDLWANSGLQPKVDIIREKYCPDGLHPNDAGHEKIAEYIGRCLEAL